MNRLLLTLAVSMLFVPLVDAQTEAIQKEVDEQLKSLRANDAELKRVLANHPDIRIAEAKIQLAREQLHQAERDLTKRYTDLKSSLKVQRFKIEFLEATVARIQKQKKEGIIAESTLASEELKLVELKAELAKMETELQSMIGGTKVVENNAIDLKITRLDAIKNELNINIEPGSTLDKLRSVIDQPVEFKSKNNMPAADALEAIQNKLGAKVLVRMSDLITLNKPLIVNVDGKMPFSSWVEMIIDDCNSQTAMLGPIFDGKKPVFDAYVRDYGVLITYTFKRPTEAITLREFTALVRAENAAKTAPKK